MGEANYGWTAEAIKAFSDRSIAIDEFQKAERALAVARANLRQAERTYVSAVDAMVSGRRAPAEATGEGEGHAG